MKLLSLRSLFIFIATLILVSFEARALDSQPTTTISRLLTVGVEMTLPAFGLQPSGRIVVNNGANGLPVIYPTTLRQTSSVNGFVTYSSSTSINIRNTETWISARIEFMYNGTNYSYYASGPIGSQQRMLTLYPTFERAEYANGTRQYGAAAAPTFR